MVCVGSIVTNLNNFHFILFLVSICSLFSVQINKENSLVAVFIFFSIGLQNRVKYKTCIDLVLSDLHAWNLFNFLYFTKRKKKRLFFLLYKMLQNFQNNIKWQFWVKRKNGYKSVTKCYKNWKNCSKKRFPVNHSNRKMQSSFVCKKATPLNWVTEDLLCILLSYYVTL